MKKDRIRLYGDSRSGNCYKLKHLCAEMGIGYDWREVDILAGDTRTPEFLAKNPNGKIPLLELPDGRYLAESNAILYYLADGSEFFAGDVFARARIMQWLFFEQYSHEPYIATSRFIVRYLGSPKERQAELEQKKSGGLKALSIMERQLADHEYVTGSSFNIADIALFAYTHVAAEGGFSLDSYPAVNAWIERIRRRPNFVPMESGA
jgi:glutathione S-transferase